MEQIQQDPRHEEKAKWGVKVTLSKFASREDFERGKVAETVEQEGNLLLNEGITRLLNLLIGGGGTAYNNANARIGVGNGTAAAAATQTALQGGSTAFKGMDATYPQVSAQTVTFRATFTETEGNFAWEEWTVDNGAGANENLNRKVASLGTKSSGTIWQFTVSITIS